MKPYVGEHEEVSNSCLKQNFDSASKQNERQFSKTNKRSSVGFDKDLSSARQISIYDETRMSGQSIGDKKFRTVATA